MSVSSFSPRQAASEKLRRSLPEYAGYERAADRPTSDAALRRTLILLLKKALERLNATTTANDQDPRRRTLVAAGRKLKTLCVNLDRPGYSSAPFFNGQELEQHLSQRLEDLDFVLLEEVEQLADEVQLITPDLSADEIKERFVFIDDIIDNLNQHIFERGALIAAGLQTEETDS